MLRRLAMHRTTLGLLAPFLFTACSGSAPPDGPGPTGGADGGGPGWTADAGSNPLPHPTPEADAGPSFADAGSSGPAPLEGLDDVSLYVVVGDSIAAGYDATGRNGEGGRAFARLLVDNHPSRGDWAGKHLAARYPGVRFERVAESGATSDEILANLRSALSGSLPGSVPGDVVVSINAGGNDFNDSIATILDGGRTAAVAARVRENILEMIRLLRDRYEDEAAGKRVLVMVHNLHDPTDGAGRIPPEFDEGFCGTIQHPLLTDGLRSAALDNLATMNAEYVRAASEGDAVLVDVHAGFMGHGMNGGAERWLSGDCTHPTDEGHHQLRRLAWESIAGI